MKNTAKIAALAIVLMFGASIVKADGIIIGDRAEKGCTKPTEGIIIGDRATGFFGSIVGSLEGIIIGDNAEKPCDEKSNEGIIIGDRAGILVSD